MTKDQIIDAKDVIIQDQQNFIDTADVRMHHLDDALVESQAQTVKEKKKGKRKLKVGLSVGGTIGVAIGVELYLVALVATPLVFLILEMRPLSEYISGRRARLPLPRGLRRDEGSADDEDEGRDRTED